MVIRIKERAGLEAPQDAPRLSSRQQFRLLFRARSGTFSGRLYRVISGLTTADRRTGPITGQTLDRTTRPASHGFLARLAAGISNSELVATFYFHSPVTDHSHAILSSSSLSITWLEETSSHGGKQKKSEDDDRDLEEGRAPLPPPGGSCPNIVLTGEYSAECRASCRDSK